MTYATTRSTPAHAAWLETRRWSMNARKHQPVPVAPTSSSSSSPVQNSSPVALIEHSGKGAGDMPNDSPCAGEHPRLDWLLWNWSRFMRVGGMEDLAVVTAEYWASGSRDFDEMVDNADLNDVIATNASINDLPPDQQVAIHHWHLQAVWRTNREPIEVVYARARVNVSAGLFKREVT
jgi:hypothetical protein